MVLASRYMEILRNNKHCVQNNVDKDRLLVGVIAVLATMSWYGSIPENIILSASISNSSNQSEMSQIDVNASNDNILKAQILANSLENRLKDSSNIRDYR